MPKVTLGLEAAKAKDADILAKLSKVQHAAQSHKQHTKLGQQRLEWTEQARKLIAEARRLEDDLQDVAGQLGLAAELVEDRQAGRESEADVWFQVSGARKLVLQVRQRDPERLRQAPEQAISLQGVLGSVSAAISSLGRGIAANSAELEQECGTARRGLRRELAVDGAWSAERGAEDFGDLSEDEDTLLERIGDGPEAYETELCRLNEQVSGELAQLEQELAELRRKRAGWNDEAHFRFLCARRQFQGRGRDLLMDRLCLEFPHLTREQLQAHEALCDTMKYAAQRHAAAFRQWRRERLALLRQHQDKLRDRQRAEDFASARRQAMVEQRDRQKKLHGRLETERARSLSRREARQQAEDEEQRRRHAAEAEREQVHRKRAHSVKELSRQHVERRQEQRVQQEEEVSERERREAEDKERRMRRNAQVVRLRRQMDDLKQREAAQQRSAAEQEQREREQRLQQVLEQLRPEAPRDPERLLKAPTRLQAEAYADPLVCVTRGPHAGFDERRLMGDARYKLSAALQASGLYGTQAGHQVLSGVPAPRPNQPHIVSQVFTDPSARGYP